MPPHLFKDTFTWCKYAMSGTSVAETVKRVSKRVAAYYTHPEFQIHLITNCHHRVQFPCLEISKPTSQETTKNEPAEMRAWTEMHVNPSDHESKK